MFERTSEADDAIYLLREAGVTGELSGRTFLFDLQDVDGPNSFVEVDFK